MLLYRVATFISRVYAESPVSLGSVEFEYNSTEDFNGVAMTIGWIQFSSCIEGTNPSIMNPQYTYDELMELAQSAVTVKIMPSMDIPGINETAAYTVKADLCSNPVYALNHGYSMSFTVSETSDPPVITGLGDTNNWIGASSLMSTNCYGLGNSLGAEPTLFGVVGQQQIFQAACGGGGLHVGWVFRESNDYCLFSWDNVVGHDITVWFGFDAHRVGHCIMSNEGEYHFNGM